MKPLTLTEKKEFFNSLFYLYSAGYSYTEAFRSIEESSRRRSIKQLCFSIRAKIENGIPFRDIISSYKEILGDAYSMLICAGDMSGKLDETLASVLKDISRTENLRSMLISSLTYPVLLLLGAIGVFFFCRFFFFKIFDVMYTTGMCAGSMKILFFTAIIKIVLIYVLLFAAVFWVVKNKKIYQKFLDVFIKYTPIADLLNNYYYNNFFSVMAASYDAGITVSESVSLAASVVKTKQAFLALYKASSVLSRGIEVTIALSNTGLFSDFALSQIAMGEKTGRLGEAFQKAAADYERKLQDALSIISRLVQPAAILLMGLLVGYIAVTFYSKLYGGIFNAL